MLVDAAAHASGASQKAHIAFVPVSAIFGHDGKTHNRKQGNRQNTKDKTKQKQRAEDISQKLTSLFLGDPCRTACFVGLTTRSSVAGGL